MVPVTKLGQQPPELCSDWESHAISSHFRNHLDAVHFHRSVLGLVCARDLQVVQDFRVKVTFAHWTSA